MVVCAATKLGLLTIFVFLCAMKKPVLHTVLSPALLNLYDVSNSIVVIIDVLRATSTICTALQNGAAKVIPVASVDDCIRIGAELNAITAGERDGKIIEGLQYGNSPFDYPKDFVQGKTLVLTTTNGTKLLHMALEKGAHGIITGSFPNLKAVCEYLIQQNHNVILGCSAWKDRFNLEDTWFAGAVYHQIKDHFVSHCDSTMAAEQLYLQAQPDLFESVKKTTHYHRLSGYGLDKDIRYCVQADSAQVVPVFKDGALVVA
jgi:2-phosphosulfolactate phosphatase